MLHFAGNCLLPPHWPLHPNCLDLLQQLITTRITHRETQFFPSVLNDLHSIQVATADLQDKESNWRPNSKYTDKRLMPRRR